MAPPRALIKEGRPTRGDMLIEGAGAALSRKWGAGGELANNSANDLRPRPASFADPSPRGVRVHLPNHAGIGFADVPCDPVSCYLQAVRVECGRAKETDKGFGGLF